MPAQRLLTNIEILEFLSRHPLEAEYVTKTKIAIATGLYDWTQTYPSWFFGMIPPWGTQVDDAVYGTVTIFFGQNDGQLYVSAYSMPIADINKAPYVPPPHKCANGSDAVLGFCPEDFNFLYMIGFGVAAYVGYQMFFAKPKR